MIRYSRHVGDYATGTQGFSIEEHGAYNLLMDAYYASEKPIPADDAYAIARAITPAHKKATDKVLSRKFILRDGFYHHTRIEAEIAAYQEKAERNRTVGVRGGRPRKNPERNPEITQTVSKEEPNANPKETLAISHKPEAIENPSQQAASQASNSPGHEAPLAALAAVCLRSRVNADGGKGLLHLRQFVADGVTEAMLTDAVLLARDRKPDPEVIPIAYLAPIIADLRSGKARARPATWEETKAAAMAAIAAKEAASGPH